MATQGFSRCTTCASALRNEGTRLDAEAERARYLLHRNDPEDPGYAAWLRGFVAMAEGAGLKPGMAVLDYGSGPEPALAGMLRAKGYEACAWDPIFAPNAEAFERSYGAVLCLEVAEHFREPFVSFKEIGSLLAPEGLVVLRTSSPPGSDEAFSRWWYKEDPTHVVFYSEAGMKAVTGRAGLRLESRPSERDWVLRRAGSRLGRY
jgi:hypothetical protein